MWTDKAACVFLFQQVNKKNIASIKMYANEGLERLLFSFVVTETQEHKVIIFRYNRHLRCKAKTDS